MGQLAPTEVEIAWEQPHPLKTMMVNFVFDRFAKQLVNRSFILRRISMGARSSEPVTTVPTYKFPSTV